MHIKSAVRAGLLAGPALLLPAPSTAGHPGSAVPGAGHGGVTVSPRLARPGGRVHVRATCDDAAQSAAVSSPAWGTVTGPLVGANRVNLATTVRPDIPARTFSVTVTCDTGHRVFGSVRIGRGGHRARRHQRWARPGRTFQNPFGPPMTGGGGSQHGGVPTGPVGLALIGGALAIGGLTLARVRARARGRR